MYTIPIPHRNLRASYLLPWETPARLRTGTFKRVPIAAIFRAELAPRRLLSGPEVCDGNTVKVICKGDDFCACVEDNAAHPFPADCAS
jgi:hypothetical protein